MRVFHGTAGLSRSDFRSPAVSIGVFDGVHRGHRHVLELLRAFADRLGGDAVVVTFDRDVAQVPTNSCFENITLVDERTLEITYRKDKVNAGQVLTALTADGLAIVDVSTRDPDLEDVFLSLTSAPLEPA